MGVKAVGAWIGDVLCGFLAYVGARAVWGGYGVFEKLHLELLTFALIYLLLKALVRGWARTRRRR